MDGWRGVVKYKVNYLTLSRYEEAHRRLNIDAPASEGKMKRAACLRSGFLIMNSALLAHGFSRTLPHPPFLLVEGEKGLVYSCYFRKVNGAHGWFG